MSSLRTMFAFDVSIDPERFARSCRDWGIDTPVLHPGFFRDARMARALAAEGRSLWFNLPVFFDPAYLERHPERYAITSQGRRAVTDWLHIACPSREETVEHAAAELRAALSWLEPEVVSLDFIRHFVFWERVDLDGPPDAIEDGCYCPVCLSSFERDRGERVDRTDPARYIRRRMKREWGDWKCRRIAEVARRLFAEIRSVRRDVTIAVKTVPWRPSDLDGAIRSSVGQDVVALTRDVDLAVPMAFTHMLRRTPEWKRDILAHVSEVTGKPVVCYVQVDAVDRTDPITPSQFEDELTAALSGGYAGISVFSYEHLVASPEKAQILRTHLR